jgi:serine/threonine-protein kinase HipA
VFNSNPALQNYAYSGSYPRLAVELRRYSADARADQEQLFRRMVFNVAISNTDDHDRNHGLLAADLPGTYRLSPAYDLVPRLHGTRRHVHAMTLGGSESVASRQNLLADCASFGLSESQAASIIDDTVVRVQDNWRQCLLDQGVSVSGADRLRSCFTGIEGPQ